MFVNHDPVQGKFSILEEAGEGYLLYKFIGPGLVDIFSTFVPPQLRGRGLAERLVEAAMQYMRTQNHKVLPSCWYVRGLMQHHAGYRDLLTDHAGSQR